ERLPPFRERLGRGLQLLTTPHATDLRRILTEPARRAGYRFEDDDLVDEMVSSVEQRAGTRPLLAFTAARLWEARERTRQLLTRRAYREMGGVGGALAQHADETLEQMTSDERE